MHSATRKVVSADGIRINVEVDEPELEAPHLPTIVFVHGVICTLDTWHYQRLALRGQVRMVFMDQRSHGGSDVADRDSSTIENLAADLHAVIEACTNGPVVLVGHSMGGMTIMQLAADHPELFGDQRGRGDAAQHEQPPAPRVVARRAAHRPVRPPRRSARRLGQGLQQLLRRAALGAGAERPGAARRHDERDDPAAPRPACSPTSTRCSPRSTSGTRSRRCRTIPTIVVAGTHDSVTPLSHSRRIADGIAGSSLVIFEDTGHMAMFEEHVRVTELILELAEKTAP